MTRIAFAHYSREDDIGGVTTWLIRLASDLHQGGWPVAVHLHHSGGDPDRSPIVSTLRARGVEVDLQSPGAGVLQGVHQTLDFLNRWQPTVFLPQCLPVHVLAASLAGRQGLPWALTIHSDDPQYWSMLRVVRPSRCGGRTVCVSHHLAAEVKRLGFDADPILIPYGVPIPSHATHRDDQRFHVVYCGRVVEEQKRIGLVVEALIQACQASSRIRATIIGDGSALPDCQRQVREAGLADAIRFPGRVSPDTVQDLLADAQAMLLLSDFEGLPVALVEAMAGGVVPVVRAIASGIPELVHHERTGLLVSADPAEAAAAILRLAGDPELWLRCSAASRELVSRDYSQASCLQRWIRLIGDLQSCEAPRDPIRPPRLPFTTTIQGAAIDWLWSWPQRKKHLAGEGRSRIAQLKHRLRQTLR